MGEVSIYNHVRTNLVGQQMNRKYPSTAADDGLIACANCG